jgi:flagellar motor switch protein FliG
MGAAAQSLRHVTDATELSGIERAAVLLMYLDEETARVVLEHVPEDEVRDIGIAMATLDRVEPEVVELIVTQFVLDMTSAQMTPQRGEEFALNVLPRLVSPARRQRIERPLRRQLSKSFEQFVAQRPPAAIAAILLDEHPQTRAIALLMMGPETASSVLEQFEEPVRQDLVRRMAKTQSVPSDLADEVETAMRLALEDHGADSWRVDGVSRAAKMVGRFERDSQEDLFDAIEEDDPELSELLRKKIVVFDDLTVLEDRAVQNLLKNVERSVLVLALRGAPPALTDLFTRNLSSRARQDVIEEIELLGRVPRNQVEEAREQIVELVLDLVENGAIPPLVGGGEELV